MFKKNNGEDKMSIKNITNWIKKAIHSWSERFRDTPFIFSLNDLSYALSVAFAYNREKGKKPKTLKQLIEQVDAEKVAEDFSYVENTWSKKFPPLIFIRILLLQRILDEPNLKKFLRRLKENTIPAQRFGICTIPPYSYFSKFKRSAGRDRVGKYIDALAINLLLIVGYDKVPEDFKDEFAEKIAESNEIERYKFCENIYGISGSYGINYFVRFLHRSGTLSELGKACDEKEKGFPLMDILPLLLCSILLGYGRFYAIEANLEEPYLRTFCYILDHNPGLRTFYRDFHRFKPDALERIFHTMIMDRYKKRHSEGLRIAIDSTNIVVYGKKYMRIVDDKPGKLKRVKNPETNKYEKFYKLFVVLDARNKIPICFHLTDGSVHDTKLLKSLIRGTEKLIGENVIEWVYIDKGFQKGTLFDWMRKNGLKFITPAKKFEKNKKDAEKTVTYKQISKKRWIGRTQIKVTMKDYPGKLRLVVEKRLEKDPKTKKDIEMRYLYLTNNCNLSAREIVKHYRKRWSVENFFKELKGAWSLEKLPSNERDAIKSHICLIMIMYLCAHEFKKTLRGYENATLSTLIDHVFKRSIQKLKRGGVIVEENEDDPRITDDTGISIPVISVIFEKIYVRCLLTGLGPPPTQPMISNEA